MPAREFFSYAWEDDAYRNWVKALAAPCLKDGARVTILVEMEQTVQVAIDELFDGDDESRFPSALAQAAIVALGLDPTGIERLRVVARETDDRLPSMERVLARGRRGSELDTGPRLLGCLDGL